MIKDYGHSLQLGYCLGEGGQRTTDEVIYNHLGIRYKRLIHPDWLASVNMKSSASI